MSGSPIASAGKKTGVGAASRAAGPGLALRRRAMMLGLLVASLAASERAQAQCAPPAGSNVTATCTGTTLNQNPPNGFGTGTEDNLNTTVVQGATVTGNANANGTAAAFANGIFFNTGSVTSSGAISGIGTDNGSGIRANDSATVTNSNTISGTGGTLGVGIFANTATVTNNFGGTISGTGGTEGDGIFANDSATVFNSGTISGTGGTGGTNGFGIDAFRNNATVSNSGTISGTAGAGGVGIGIQANNNVTVTNNFGGTISGTGGTGIGIQADTATVFNSGTVGAGAGTGGIGIFVGAAGNVTTSGTIIGSGGTAIRFNGNRVAASDILTVLPGARFGGLVNFGGGADTVNFGPGSWILNTAQFDAGLSRVNTSGNPSVVTPTQIIVADLSGFAAQNRAILDITGWIGSVLPDTPVFAPGAGGGASAFAALDTAASPFDAFASFPSEALGSAKAPALKAASAVYADGNAVWAKGFGGQRVQDTSGAFIGGLTTGAGGAVGYERMIDPDLKAGVLVGGSTNKTNLYFNAGSTSTDTVFGGAYGRKMWGGTFLDLAVIGGNLANTNVRNIGGGLGLVSANASYGGWFIDPSLAFGHRFEVNLVPGNFTITPAVKVRYLDAHFDGYAESGAGVANLVVAGRDFQAWEERAELTFANSFTVANGHRVMVRVTGGALAQQRSAGGQVNIALVGQNFLAATPDRGSISGAFGGAGLDWQMGNVTLFAAGEATGTNDSTRTFAAKGGARMSW